VIIREGREPILLSALPPGNEENAARALLPRRGNLPLRRPIGMESPMGILAVRTPLKEENDLPRDLDARVVIIAKLRG
jgi:hypothetical protein